MGEKFLDGGVVNSGSAVYDEATFMRMFDEFKRQDNDSFGFEINRNPMMKGGPLISKEALSLIEQQITMFLGARMLARHEKTGRAVRSVHVIVSVAIDDGGDDDGT